MIAVTARPPRVSEGWARTRSGWAAKRRRLTAMRRRREATKAVTTAMTPVPVGGQRGEWSGALAQGKRGDQAGGGDQAEDRQLHGAEAEETGDRNGHGVEHVGHSSRVLVCAPLAGAGLLKGP